MPQAVAFDTHAAVKRLVKSGFSEEQAEVYTDIIRELIEDKLATKQYLDGKLAELEAGLKHDNLQQSSQVRVEIAKIKAETLKWVAGMMLAQAGIIATLVKLL